MVQKKLGWICSIYGLDLNPRRIIKANPPCAGFQLAPAVGRTCTALLLHDGEHALARKLARLGIVRAGAGADVKIRDADTHKERIRGGLGGSGRGCRIIGRSAVAENGRVAQCIASADDLITGIALDGVDLVGIHLLNNTRMGTVVGRGSKENLVTMLFCVLYGLTTPVFQSN